jgi:hypothetical protein
LESTGLFEGDDEAEIKEKIDWVVYGVNISEEKMIMVFKFKKTADAKELVEEAGEEEGFAIERQMSYVFIGTDKDAIKDAK